MNDMRMTDIFYSSPDPPSCLCIIIVDVQNLQVIGLIKELLSINPEARPKMKHVVNFLGKLYYGQNPTEVSHARGEGDVMGDGFTSVYHTPLMAHKNYSSHAEKRCGRWVFDEFVVVTYEYD